MGKPVLTVVLCLLLGCAIPLAGCGGGGGDSGSTENGGEAAAGANAGREGGGGGSGEEAGEAGESTSGGEESTLAPTSESKQEFVVKATSLCKKQQKSMRAGVLDFLKSAKDSKASVQASQRRFVEEVLAPGFEAEAEGLRNLGAPEGEEEQVEAVIAAIELAIEEARRDPSAYFGGAPVFKEASRVPAAYGIPACGTIS